MSAPTQRRPARATRKLEEAPRARPFLKWAGGKSQLLPEILRRLPDRFNRYYEPFLGGGAVFFALQPEKATLSDINHELIATYQAIRNDVEGVIHRLRRQPNAEEHFYRLRSQKHHRLSRPAQAARTIYLNRTCYNGLYRVNKRGEFNVPFGRYRNPRICDADNLRRVAATLRRSDVRRSNVFDLHRRARRNDLVYFDPPYDPVSATASFTSYTEFSFGRDEQAHLAELFRRLAERGVHVLLSNSDTPFIRSLYRGFRIERVRARRAINSAANKRGPVNELLISVG